jgi:hypothetical protein
MYDEPNYITENKPQMQAMFEILKPSLNICYTIWNQILYYYMQQFGPAFLGCYFTGLPDWKTSVSIIKLPKENWFAKYGNSDTLAIYILIINVYLSHPVNFSSVLIFQHCSVQL